MIIDQMNKEAWDALKKVNDDKLRFVAASLARSVLYIWELAYPNDNAPRKAIEEAERPVLDKRRLEEARKACVDARYDAYNDKNVSATAAADAASFAASVAKTGKRDDVVWLCCCSSRAAAVHHYGGGEEEEKQLQIIYSYVSLQTSKV